MKKVIFCFLIIILTACSMSDQELKNSYTHETLRSTVTPSTDHNSLEKESIASPNSTTWEEEMENSKEQRKREGDIVLEHTEVVGVEGELLETIKLIFEAINKEDEKARLQLMYDPINFDEFGSEGPYILEITKLELDNSRREAVIDEYELDQIAEEVAIVKISRKTLTTKFEESLSTGDYIFIKTKAEQKWKLYRLQ